MFFLFFKKSKYPRYLLLLLLINTSAFADNSNAANSSSRILGNMQNLSSNQSAMVNKNDSYMFALSKDYEFIFFYSSNCHYCIKFNPVLKLYSDNSGIWVKAFAIGNGSSPYFPSSTVVAQEVVDQFFGSFEKRTNISVPTLFIMNKNNLHVYPVSSGALTYLELYTRMNDLVPKILRYEKYEKNERNERGKNNV